MDLKRYDTRRFAQEGALLHVRGPDGALLYCDPPEGADESYEPPPVTIRLAGADSKRYSDARHRASKAKQEFSLAGGDVQVDMQQATANAILVAAACTIAWEGIDYDGVSPFPCTEENAARMYRELPWLREQVQAFIHERANYLGGGSASS